MVVTRITFLIAANSRTYNATVAILCRYSGALHSSGIPALRRPAK
jgi:hypothetical protein